MKSRKRVFAAVLLLLSLPLVLASVAALSFHVRNRNNRSIVSSGEKRDYLLYVPKSYDPARPAPLVLSLHGAGGWPVLQKETSGWNRLAERHGFLVAYPSGRRGRGPRVWRVNRGEGLLEDVRFLADLLDELEEVYNVDPARVYANGISNGGGMTFALSCTLSGRFAAVGMVAAAQTLPWSWCPDPRPVPMIAFHGTADPIVPYEGGTSWIGPVSFPPVPEWTASWARRNRCGPGSVDSTVASDVTRREYSGCAGGADVVLFTIHGGGHTWPGGKPFPEWFLGTTSRGVDATGEMWSFFEEHPRAEGITSR